MSQSELDFLTEKCEEVVRASGGSITEGAALGVVAKLCQRYGDQVTLEGTLITLNNAIQNIERMKVEIQKFPPTITKAQLGMRVKVVRLIQDFPQGTSFGRNRRLHATGSLGRRSDGYDPNMYYVTYNDHSSAQYNLNELEEVK